MCSPMTLMGQRNCFQKKYEFSRDWIGLVRHLGSTPRYLDVCLAQRLWKTHQMVMQGPWMKGPLPPIYVPALIRTGTIRLWSESVAPRGQILKLNLKMPVPIAQSTPRLIFGSSSQTPFLGSWWPLIRHILFVATPAILLTWIFSIRQPQIRGLRYMPFIPVSQLHLRLRITITGMWVVPSPSAVVWDGGDPGRALDTSPGFLFRMSCLAHVFPQRSSPTRFPRVQFDKGHPIEFVPQPAHRQVCFYRQ